MGFFYQLQSDEINFIVYEIVEGRLIDVSQTP
jgi:hypothetical protein